MKPQNGIGLTRGNMSNQIDAEDNYCNKRKNRQLLVTKTKQTITCNKKTKPTTEIINCNTFIIPNVI